MLDRHQDVTVMVALNHPAMLKVVSDLLAQTFCVAAAVPTGGELLRAALGSWPEVFVVDLELPVGDGVDSFLARLGVNIVPVRACIDIMLAVRSLGIQTPFVFLGMETKGTDELLKQGAAAYVHKADVYADLRQAIRLAADGRSFISRSASITG